MLKPVCAALIFLAFTALGYALKLGVLAQYRDAVNLLNDLRAFRPLLFERLDIAGIIEKMRTLGAADRFWEAAGEGLMAGASGGAALVEALSRLSIAEAEKEKAARCFAAFGTRGAAEEAARLDELIRTLDSSVKGLKEHAEQKSKVELALCVLGGAAAALTVL